MKTKRFEVLTILALVLVTMVGMTGCGNKNQKEARLQKVRLYEVKSEGGIMHILYPGRTKAAASSEVAFKVAGTLQKVAVKVGDKVRRGQLLAVMDDHDYQVQLKATQAEYESVKAECERIIALYQDNGTAENNYDKARYGLEQITQKLQHAQDQVNDCRITSPYDGYVSDVYHDPGETIGAGMAVASVFATNGVEIVIYVPARDYQRRNLVDKFTATFDAVPGEVFPLKMTSVSARANVNQLYEVHLQLDASATQITPGMTAMVDLQLVPLEFLQLEIPAVAVFADSEGTSYVWVYDEQTQQVSRRKVEVNSIDLDGQAIISDGLKAGERIVASGVHHLSEGEKVEPNPEPSKTNVGGLL